MIQPSHTARQYGPQLWLRKTFLLQSPLPNLIIECSHGILKERINFIKSGTVLLLRTHKEILQLHHMAIAGQFPSQLSESIHHLVALLDTSEIEFFEQIFVMGYFVLEKFYMLSFVLLDDVVGLQEIVLVLFGSTRTHFTVDMMGIVFGLMCLFILY